MFSEALAGFSQKPSIPSSLSKHQFPPTNSLTFLDGVGGTKTLHQDTVLKPSYGSYLSKHLYMTQIIIVTDEFNRGNYNR